MTKRSFIRRFFALAVVLTVLFSFSPKTFAITEYEKIIELPTTSVSGWKEGESVTVSANTVKDGDLAAISFTSNGVLISGSYSFSAQWSEFGVKANELLLKTRIFISDISALAKTNGKIALSGEGYSFSWKISDLSLETGWNDVTLNFRTADLSEPIKETAPEDSQTEPAEGEETVETEEQEETGETVTLPITADEILLKINNFSFDAERTASKPLTVAFSALSVCVPAEAEAPEPPEPITDEIDNGLLIAAIIIAVAIFAGTFIYSAVYAKKEIKRRKREAKRRKREKSQEENKNEE